MCCKSFQGFGGFGVQQVMINFFFSSEVIHSEHPQLPHKLSVKLGMAAAITVGCRLPPQVQAAFTPLMGFIVGFHRVASKCFSSEAASSKAQQQNSGWLKKSRSPFPDSWLCVCRYELKDILQILLLCTFFSQQNKSMPNTFSSLSCISPFFIWSSISYLSLLLRESLPQLTAVLCVFPYSLTLSDFLSGSLPALYR